MIVMIYKDNLKALRNRLGLTQESVASILGIAKARYSQYENEVEIFPLKHLNTLCNYFQVSFDYLFNFTEEKQYDNSRCDIVLTLSGNRLKEWRKSMDLTQDKLAQKLNVARSLISKYEKGEYLISTHSLYSICKKYKVSADFLLGKID